MALNFRAPLSLVLSLAAVSAGAAERPVFYAAAGKVDITPNLKKETVWLAGYGATGRRAKGVRDPLYARALVLSDGKKTVALVAVDSIGIYRKQVLAIRRKLGWQSGDNYLFLAATHDHSAPDTLGLWGRFPGVSGVDKRYRKRLKAAIANLVLDLAGSLEEAELSAARKVLDPSATCRDSRDPVVLDPELNVLQLRSKKGKIIGTVLRWSCHPEVLGRENEEVTADYPGALCARVEEKTGGGCVFFPGVIGGLLGPVVDRSKGLEHQFAVKDQLGITLADAALDALSKDAERIIEPAVSFSSRTVRLRVDNSRYLAFLRSLAFGHTLYDESGKRLPAWKTYWYPLRHLGYFPLPESLRPWIETELALVRLGPVRILGIPGELFPELAIGGYGGEHRYVYPLVGPTNPNPPDLKSAPPPPYLREKLKAKHGLLVGLANDMLGYIIPEYDFQAAPTRSMTPKPKGTHYEETNSTGRGTAALVLNAYDELLRSSP